MSWICPDCERLFGRTGQSHVCSPALSLDEYFSSGPSFERPVYEAVIAHLETLGPITVEPVQVGIFLKAGVSFVELRTRTKWVAMSFPLARRESHRRIVRAPMSVGAKWYHVANLADPDDYDDDLRSLLEESYALVLAP